MVGSPFTGGIDRRFWAFSAQQQLTSSGRRRRPSTTDSEDTPTFAIVQDSNINLVSLVNVAVSPSPSPMTSLSTSPTTMPSSSTSPTSSTSASPSNTPSPTHTATPSSTPSPTGTTSMSASRIPTPTQSTSPTTSGSPSSTASVSPSTTASVTPSSTTSVTPSSTASVGGNSTVSIPPSSTASVTPRSTASVSPSSIASVSASVTASVSVSASPNASPTSLVTQSPTASVTPSQSASVTASASVSLSPSPESLSLIYTLDTVVGTDTTIGSCHSGAYLFLLVPSKGINGPPVLMRYTTSTRAAPVFDLDIPFHPEGPISSDSIIVCSVARVVVISRTSSYWFDVQGTAISMDANVHIRLYHMDTIGATWKNELFAVLGEGGNLRLFDVDDGEQIISMSVVADIAIVSSIVALQNVFIAIVDNMEVVVFGLDGYEKVHNLSDDFGSPCSACRLVVVQENCVLLYDPFHSGATLLRLTADRELVKVTSLPGSPSSIASSGQEMVERQYDTTSVRATYSYTSALANHPYRLRYTPPSTGRYRVEIRNLTYSGVSGTTEDCSVPEYFNFPSSDHIIDFKAQQDIKVRLSDDNSAATVDYVDIKLDGVWVPVCVAYDSWSFTDKVCA
ncbi:hypothetical protein SARC_04943 [Sphaeroforma arctica JP610]|uniref:Uncharacterized protein n=1 Tax=Sphaeroforma arctica JP610 TaxID=667725 RepID=A0A0L0G125_9EUKA|nr:hypothetical protein SARC_04943 [Sphaeroforma arctica JP610]KNC82785.1 hypothetical protein SARC_04943 [Sphaeroforma arctica JP610]|eukprot:XP_014156687.1 hypothetical protein SARC_04943 [Sphaeroforma arctica JP610]